MRVGDGDHATQDAGVLVLGRLSVCCKSRGGSCQQRDAVVTTAPALSRSQWPRRSASRVLDEAATSSMKEL